MAKIIFFFSALASSQTLAQSQDTCVDLDTCSTIPGHASKSAALLQVGNVVNKKAQKDLPLARATDETSRPTMPADTQLGELLARVESLEAVAPHAIKDDVAWTQAPSDRALDAKTVDSSLLDRAIDKSRSYGGVSSEREAEMSRRSSLENEIADGVSEAFTNAVEDRVAERKALADKAAFDAAVEKAVDEKLAADGIFPVPAGEDRTGIAPLTAVETTEQALHSQLDYGSEGADHKRLQRYAVEPSRDKVLSERGDEKLGDTRSIKVAEELASDHSRHDTRMRSKDESVGEDGYSEDAKTDGDATKWIGDDLSETYVDEHKESHSGHSVKGREDHDEDHSQSSHSRQYSDANTDNDNEADNDSETEKEHRGSRKGRAKDSDAEESFEQATLRQKSDYEKEEEDRLETKSPHKRHYENEETEEADYEDDAEEARKTVAKQTIRKSNKKGRGETVESEVEEHVHAKKPAAKRRQLREEINEDNEEFDDKYEEDNDDSWRAPSKKAHKEVRDFDDEDEDNTAWNAVARRVKRKSNEDDRKEKDDRKVETRGKEHPNSAKKGFKKVDPKEKYNEDFPYEMLMDVDFIVDPITGSDSADDAQERTGDRKSRESEKPAGRDRVPPKFKAEAHSSEKQHSDEFRSERSARPAVRNDGDDDEAQEIIFDQQSKKRDQQKQMKKRRSSEEEDDRELDEALEDNED